MRQRQKKMTKDIRYVVEEANRILATPYMQNNDSERECLHHFISHLLLEKNMYHGFNYFVEDEVIGLRLAGRETKIIQFYVV